MSGAAGAQVGFEKLMPSTSVSDLILCGGATETAESPVREAYTSQRPSGENVVTPPKAVVSSLVWWLPSRGTRRGPSCEGSAPP